MPLSTLGDRIPLDEFIPGCIPNLIPYNNAFSYFSLVPLEERDKKDYLENPILALPPAFSKLLPQVALILVPYLERATQKKQTLVVFQQPADKREVLFAERQVEEKSLMLFPVKSRDASEYHYLLFNALARLAVAQIDIESMARYKTLLREELSAHVHGEVDEDGWRIKQELIDKQDKFRRETKLFQAYLTQSLIDTLTLYLHGICCDIDVEPGPRQLSSRYLRKRLQLLRMLFPPPQGYAVFPEENGRANTRRDGVAPSAESDGDSERDEESESASEP